VEAIALIKTRKAQLIFDKMQARRNIIMPRRFPCADH
jgi:hypothetical protein